jgi:hypothetical protein
MLKMKTISILAIAGLVLALAPAAQAALLDWTSSVVGPYRIAFTADGTSYGASSSDITSYNTLVAAEAAGTDLNGLGATWNVIGSTQNVNARKNTGTYTLALDGAGLYVAADDVPIYTAAGVLIATGNSDLWDGSIAVAIAHIDGTPIIPATAGNGWDYHRVYTGTTSNGSSMTSGDGRYMGYDNGSFVRKARGGYTDGGWIGADNGGTSSGLMALSNPIPEPATMSLLAIGGIALIRRRRRA